MIGLGYFLGCILRCDNLKRYSQQGWEFFNSLNIVLFFTEQKNLAITGENIESFYE